MEDLDKIEARYPDNDPIDIDVRALIAELRQTRLQVEQVQKMLSIATCCCGPRGEIALSLHAPSCEYMKRMTEKPKGETFPLCECGHNHRTEPGHYTTMNCNLKGCPCTYFTEKRSQEPPIENPVPISHCPKCRAPVYTTVGSCGICRSF